MRRDDMAALGELAGEALAVSGGLIQGFHEGIASRPFGALGASAAPARLLHDGISRAVYGGLRGAAKASARGGARALALHNGRDDDPAFAATPAGALAIGAINGAWGHHLRERGHRLALEMEARRHGQEVTVDARGLAAGYPDATSRIVVFVHGLCENEESWRHPLHGGRSDRLTYGERLQDELSFTPVTLRYNTGLRISDNGRRLARLLDDLVAHWPCAVEELVLVGHSMGGLVARSACHYAERDQRRWSDAVHHVFCLGAPHLGADLEKGANALSWALGRLPETRALGALLNARSLGIKDLRYGSCVEEDWCDCDPDEFLRDRCQEVPFLPEAHYYFIAASLDGHLGALVGDLLVRIPSASGRGNGRGRRMPFEVDNGVELRGLTHFDLLNHPAVYEQIRTWIMRASGRRRATLAA